MMNSRSLLVGFDPVKPTNIGELFGNVMVNTFIELNLFKRSIITNIDSIKEKKYIKELIPPNTSLYAVNFDNSIFTAPIYSTDDSPPLDGTLFGRVFYNFIKQIKYETFSLNFVAEFKNQYDRILALFNRYKSELEDISSTSPDYCIPNLLMYKMMTIGNSDNLTKLVEQLTGKNTAAIIEGLDVEKEIPIVSPTQPNMMLFILSIVIYIYIALIVYKKYVNTNSSRLIFVVANIFAAKYILANK